MFVIAKGPTMPNRNYKRGADFERRVRDHLRSMGYYAERTAGSHGKADVVAHNTTAVPVIASRGPKPKCEIIYQEIKSQDCQPWREDFDPKEAIHSCAVLLVQCKTDNRIDRESMQDLYDAALKIVI